METRLTLRIGPNGGCRVELNDGEVISGPDDTDLTLTQAEEVMDWVDGRFNGSQSRRYCDGAGVLVATNKKD